MISYGECFLCTNSQDLGSNKSGHIHGGNGKEYLKLELIQGYKITVTIINIR